MTHNVIAGGRSASYPPGNLFPSVDDFRKQFVNFDAHDYRLARSSAWRKAGTDGKDLGADMSVVVLVPRPYTRQRQKSYPTQIENRALRKASLPPLVAFLKEGLGQ